MWLALCALPIIFVYTQFSLPYQEQRQDLVQLRDLFLEKIPFHLDSTYMTVTFSVLVLTAVAEHTILSEFNLDIIELIFFKYAVCLGVKSVTMFLCPLDVPDGFRGLVDPLSGAFTTYSDNVKNNDTYCRDLMFSGHTACLLLIIQHSTCPWLLWWYLVWGTLLIVSILASRVHYTIDVFMSFHVVFSVSSVLDMCLLESQGKIMCD